MKKKMKKASKRASLRIDLNLDDADEAACYDLWQNGFRACPGVTVSGKALFVHAVARLKEELQKERVGAVSCTKTQEKIPQEEVPTPKINLAVFD